MACRFEITLPGEDAGHVAAARQALDEVEAIEEQISAFSHTSALARLNRCAGTAPVTVDRPLIPLLSLCRALHRDTEGAFDVTSTPLSRCWGFMQRDALIPGDDEISSALAVVGMERVEIDVERQSVRFTRNGMAINFGAIGKGWALDRVAVGLRARGVSRALLSAGHSSILAVGSQSRAWPIDLTSPRAARRLARVELREGSLGTSGAGEQFIEVDGRRYGHVLDPRTGRPSDTGLLSVSVLTAEAALSDALSTAFLVGGIDLAQRYCANHAGVMAIVTREDDPRATHIFGEFPGAMVNLNEATT
jgi:thiamine biosynthesis lipoprotein